MKFRFDRCRVGVALPLPVLLYGPGTSRTVLAARSGTSRTLADLRERLGKGVISMPWRELTVIDQREEFVRLALAPGANKTELCRRFGVAHSNGCKWVSRYLAEGRAGLADRSRRPHSSPTQTASAVEAEVLRIRDESNNAWGGRKIAQVMKNEGAAVVPSPSTITEILRRHGKLEERACEHPGPYQRFEREQ